MDAVALHHSVDKGALKDSVGTEALQNIVSDAVALQEPENVALQEPDSVALQKPDSWEPVDALELMDTVALHHSVDKGALKDSVGTEALQNIVSDAVALQEPENMALQEPDSVALQKPDSWEPVDALELMNAVALHHSVDKGALKDSVGTEALQNIVSDAVALQEPENVALQELDNQETVDALELMDTVALHDSVGKGALQESVGTETLQDINIKLGEFYGVYFTRKFYVGKITGTSTSGSYIVDFLERRGANKFIWPTKQDKDNIERHRIFHGPLHFTGHHELCIDLKDLKEMQQKHRNLKKIYH